MASNSSGFCIRSSSLFALSRLVKKSKLRELEELDFKILVKNKKVFFDLNSYYEFCFLKVKEYKKRGLEVLLSYTTFEDSCQCLDFKKYKQRPPILLPR